MSTPHRLTFFEPRDYRVVFVDTKKTSGLLVFSVVLLAGFEPARYRYRGILSPLRLPVSPQQQNFRVFYNLISIYSVIISLKIAVVKY